MSVEGTPKSRGHTEVGLYEVLKEGPGPLGGRTRRTFRSSTETGLGVQRVQGLLRIERSGTQEGPQGVETHGSGRSV